MPQELSDTQWEELNKNGVLYVPGFLNEDETENFLSAVDDLYEEFPNGYVGGRFSFRSQDAEPPITPNELLSIHHPGFNNHIFHEIATKEIVLDALGRMLGKDCLLYSIDAQSIRPGTGRLDYHKDGHGQAGLILLADEIDWNSGGTAVIPKTHIGTPPPSYCLDDVFAEQPNEVQAVGSPGDAYFFFYDVWHARASNLANINKRKVLYLYQNQLNVNGDPGWATNFPLPQIDEERSRLSKSSRHILDWSDEVASCRITEATKFGWIYNWAWCNSNGAKHLFRDLVFCFMNNGKIDVSDARTEVLPPHTSFSAAASKFSVSHYLGYVIVSIAFKKVLGNILRALPFGGQILKLIRRPS